MVVQTRHSAEAVRAIEQMRVRLVAFVAARITPADDAEDIVQEVLIRINQSIGALRNAERLEAWIYQITRNAIADHRRAASRASRLHTQAALDRSLHNETADPSELAALAGCVAPMLAQLPERDRQAITLITYDGLTQAEAAARAGISVPGMKSRVQRARTRLRALLSACCQVALDARGDVRAIQPAGPCPCPCGS